MTEWQESRGHAYLHGRVVVTAKNAVRVVVDDLGLEDCLFDLWAIIRGIAPLSIVREDIFRQIGLRGIVVIGQLIRLLGYRALDVPAGREDLDFAIAVTYATIQEDSIAIGVLLQYFGEEGMIETGMSVACVIGNDTSRALDQGSWRNRDRGVLMCNLCSLDDARGTLK